jgi:replicative DNA helicase
MAYEINKYNLGFELSILRVIAVDYEKLRENLQVLSSKYFADEMYREFYRWFAGYARMYKKPLVRKSMVHVIKLRKKKRQWKIYATVMKKIYAGVSEDDTNNFKFHIEEIEKLYKLREGQQLVRNIVDGIEDANFDNIRESSRKLLSVVMHDSKNVIREGTPFSDFEERKNLMRDKIEHPEKYASIPTGIINLDKEIGGWQYGEFNYITGFSGWGKSTFLLECGYHPCCHLGKKVVHFTIEMNKAKCEYRFDSRLTGIPYQKFNRAELTGNDMRKWEDAIKKYREKGGEYLVVSYDNNCNVFDLEHKLEEISDTEFGEPDLVVLDYFNDMKPIRKFATDKNFEAVGDISWGLKILSQSWNNGKGLRMITASQGKEDGGTRYSGMPFEHATINLEMIRDDDFELYGKMWLLVKKNRDGAVGKKVAIYPNFPIYKIHSEKKRREAEEVGEGGDE